MTLVDWLDDLCVRFIVNLPQEELLSVERICFQIEEAQWFYEDFIRPLDPRGLPSMHLRKFSQLMFQHCPLFSAYSAELHQQAYDQFLAYKTRVPVRGAIMLNQDMTHAVLVKGWKKGAKWSFPRGKINKEENDLDCAVREVWEETGYDLKEANLVLPEEQMKSITVTMREQSMMLYVFRGVPMDTYFEPRTRKEISKIDWYKLTDLPTVRRKNQVQQQGTGQDLIKESSFYMVAPFLGPLRAWIKLQHKLDKQRARVGQHVAPPPAIADDDYLQPELYGAPGEDGTAPPPAQSIDQNFANLVARLGQSQPPVDPAAELKKLLSVGRGLSAPTPPVEAPGVQPQANPLLALFQGNNGPGRPSGSLPQTPFEQIVHTPMQPPEIPHASGLPTPKLTAHALGLLNSFKISDQKPNPQQAQASLQQQPQYSTPKLQQPHPQYPPHELVSPPHIMSPPTFQSPPLNQPQPKPRTVHQDSLLTLFSATPPAKSPMPAEPAELSAHPLTPGFVQAQPATGQAKPPNQALLDLFSAQTKPSLTSATVSGPVNAPDFETVKRRKQASVNGNSRRPSPATQAPMVRVGPDVTIIAASKHAQQIHGNIRTAPAPAFQPQILKRPQQAAATAPGSNAHAQGLLDMFKALPNTQSQGLLNLFKGPSPQPPPAQLTQARSTASPATLTAQPASFDRRESIPSDQRNALLGLFSKPSPQPTHRMPAQQSHSPLPFNRTPNPPTPKTAMSGLVSPVSPLQQGSRSGTPADLVSSNRISSIGEPAQGQPSIPALQGLQAQNGGAAGFGLAAAKARENDAKSPVDKTFLLGFLEDVARRGR
ncbi:DCP2-domain-containing protein [Lizonia empirigonia]|nr:DCP2-domain-containing protein [Lizonia empirigonia]